MKSVEHTDMANGKLAEDLKSNQQLFQFQDQHLRNLTIFFRRSSRLLGLIYQMFRSENRKRLPTPRIRYVLANPRTWVRQEDVNYGGPILEEREDDTLEAASGEFVACVACNFFPTPVIISRIHRRAGTMGEIVFREVSGCNGQACVTPLTTYKYEVCTI